MILVIILYAVLASTFILAKNAVAYANPFFLIGFRMIIAGLLLLGYLFFFARKKLAVNKADWWLFGKTALFHIYIAFLLEFWALQYVSALKTTLIYSLTPFISALLAYVLLNESLTKKKIIGIVIGCTGLLPIIMATAQQGGDGVYTMHMLYAEAALLISVASAAYAWFLVKELMNKGYSLILINGMAMLAGGFASMITFLISQDLSLSPVNNWVLFFAWTLSLILVANIVVYNLYGWLLRKHSITFIAFSGFLSPGFGALYEWFLLGGSVSWHYWISLGLVTIGLYTFYCDELNKS
jgi:drug/metabolite transporter (DMT)-like permease